MTLGPIMGSGCLAGMMPLSTLAIITACLAQISVGDFLLTIIGPLHMAEQMLTDIEEFHSIKRSMASYYSLFEPAAADTATVLLITIVWTVVSLGFYSMLHDGRARLIVPGVLGLFAVTEAHHVFQALAKGGYDAGLVTCLPYAAVGGLLVAAVWRELRQGYGPAASGAALATARAR